jgi:hypothetical protein
MTSRKSPAPAAPRHTGPWNEYADATGIDAKYAAEQAEADRQLKDATAGPQAVSGAPVAVGDTQMKNPHGAFAMPSPNARRHPSLSDPGVDGQSNRTPDGRRDPEGRQGGYVRTGGHEQHELVGGVRTPQGEDPKAD